VASEVPTIDRVWVLIERYKKGMFTKTWRDYEIEIALGVLVDHRKLD